MGAVFVLAGYKGFIVLIDELAYICNTANGITRQNNYEKILMMYNAALQGKAENLGIIMSGIPKSIYDKKKEFSVMRQCVLACQLAHIRIPVSLI